MHKIERAIAVHDAWVADGRPGTLAALCAAHPDLAEHLTALASDPDELDRAIADEEPVGKTLGDFRLVGELGRGGMGVVYLARQVSLDREVAVKVLPHHLTLQASTVARFRREANLAARLEHPGIVAIHAVGRDGDVHWFAMERIVGARLARVDRRTGERRTVRQCAEIAAAVADALAHAHAHGVLHRDVKPSNILMRDDGQPVLTDFGLARDLGTDRITRTGNYAGTPVYSAPEQIAGRNDVDARADVWSLGATLYELLTDRLPFDADSELAVLEKIRSEEPVDPLRLVPDLAPDLAAIVLKALEKDPARRYQTAAELRDDLRAFLEYRPVTARRASRAVRVGRWLQRHPGWRAALVVAGGALLAMPWLMSAAVAGERDRAVAAEQSARLQAYAANVLAAHNALAAGDSGQAAQRLAACPEDLRGFEWTFVASSMDRSLWTARLGAAAIESVAMSPDAKWLAAGDAAGEVALLAAGEAQPRWRRRVADAAVTRVAIDDGARWVLAATGAGAARAFDLATGQCLGELGPLGGEESAAISPDGTQVTRSEGGGRYRIADAPLLANERIVTLDLASDHPRERFASDGEAMVGGVQGGAMARWNLRTGKREAAWSTDVITAYLCADRGLRHVLSYSSLIGFAWWRAGEQDGLRLHPERRVPTCLAIAPDGTQFAAGCQTGEALVYATSGTPRLARILLGHRATVRSIAAGPNGWLATGAADGTVKLWNTLLDAGAGEITGTGFGPSLSVDGEGHPIDLLGDAFFVGAQNGVVRRIDRRTGAVAWQQQLGHWVNGLAIVGDGAAIACQYHQVVQFLSTTDGALLGPPMEVPEIGYARRFVASPDRRRIAILDSYGKVGVIDPVARRLLAHRQVAKIVPRGPHGGLAWTPDGAQLVVGSDDGRVHVLAADTLATVAEHEVGALVGALAVDGDALIVATWDRESKTGALKRLRRSDGGTLAEGDVTALVVAIAMLPGRCALARWDGRLALHRSDDLAAMLELPQPARGLWNVQAAPSGDWLALQCYGGDPRMLVARTDAPALADCGTQAAMTLARNLAAEAIDLTGWAPQARAALLARQDLAPAVRDAAIAALPPTSDWRLVLAALQHGVTLDASFGQRERLRAMLPCLREAVAWTSETTRDNRRLHHALVAFRLGEIGEAESVVAAVDVDRLGTGWETMLLHFLRAQFALARGDRATSAAELVALRADVARHGDRSFGPDLVREVETLLAQ